MEFDVLTKRHSNSDKGLLLETSDSVISLVINLFLYFGVLCGLALPSLLFGLGCSLRTVANRRIKLAFCNFVLVSTFSYGQYYTV